MAATTSSDHCLWVSKFLQCGQRNAYNEVKSRIRNENVAANVLIDERSDLADYDYDLEIALEKLDIDPEAKEIVRKIRKIRRKKQTPSGPKGPTTIDADFGMILKSFCDAFNVIL